MVDYTEAQNSMRSDLITQSGLSGKDLKYFGNEFDSLAGYLGFDEAHRIMSQTEGIVEVFDPGIQRSVSMRARSSDIPTFRQVLIDEHYSPSLVCDPKVIVDCGANVGFSSLYFNSRYPDARIISIEAEESNCEVLRQNVEGIGNIEVMHRAVWHVNGILHIANPADAKWAFRVSSGQEEGNMVESITIPEVLTSLDGEIIDLLKIDIEGAERDLFANNPGDWLGRVNAICIELHDNIYPDATSVFMRAIEEDGGFTMTKAGHVLVFERLK